MIKEFENGDILVCDKNKAVPKILITIRMENDGYWHLYREICMIQNREDAIKEAKDNIKLIKYEGE